MNQNEIKFFTENELFLYDAAALPFSYLLKSMFVKIRRNLWGRYCDKNTRMVWTVSAVSDAMGPADNVRNYLERQTIRSILSDIVKDEPILSACEVGCGYGRLIMVLNEYADTVVGFEREPHLVEVAKRLLPNIEFCQCDSLDKINQIKGPFDFAMTWTMLQHLADDNCRSVISSIKHMVPNGYVLISEKTEQVSVTRNIADGNQFISRARSVETYEEWMKPYILVQTIDSNVEPTYFNKSPGTCMVFKGQG
jgi:2-polyprenyl-3-methyl-5-hydroxy-6-metoxy-1,4-benzoquinol methylase